MTDLAFDDLCRYAASRWFIDGMDYDDLLQEARIAAWKSMQTFDSARGMNRRNYARLAIDKHLATVLKGTQREKRRAMHRYVTFDVKHGHSDRSLADVLPDGSPDAHSRLDTEAELARLTDGRHLTALEHRCLVGTMVGMHYDELGEPKVVDNALQRAKRKLRPAA